MTSPLSIPTPHRSWPVPPSVHTRERVLGVSVEGRPITARFCGAAGAPLRVLVVAGQHGDERVAIAVAEALAAASTSRLDPAVRLAVVARANPDGALARTRANAADLDLNRDHLLLESPETRALHGFVRGWRPHLVVDLHTYPARRSALLRHGLVHGADVLVETPTTPAARTSLDGDAAGALRRFVVTHLRRDGFASGRYVVTSGSGRLRHGTPDVVDLRNGLALRYGVPTLLLEGRRPSRRVAGATRARTLAGLTAALHAALDWAVAHGDTLAAGASPSVPGASVPLQARYTRAADGRAVRPCWLPMQRDGGARVLPTILPGRYTPGLRVTRARPLPAAYAVPRTLAPVLDVLARHGFATDDLRGPATAEQPFVVALKASSRPRRAPRRLALRDEPRTVARGDYAVFPTVQPGGHALAVLLEPASKYGLARMLPDALPLEVGRPYPILRLA